MVIARRAVAQKTREGKVYLNTGEAVGKKGTAIMFRCRSSFQATVSVLFETRPCLWAPIFMAYAGPDHRDCRFSLERALRFFLESDLLGDFYLYGWGP